MSNYTQLKFQNQYLKATCLSPISPRMKESRKLPASGKWFLRLMDNFLENAGFPYEENDGSQRENDQHRIDHGERQ